MLAYGQETELWRATFAVLSFYAWLGDESATVQTVVFTDRPNFFVPYLEGLPVRYSLLTSAQLEEMRGPERYVHRVKLQVVTQVFRSHPTDNVLFCDADTFFIAPAAPLLRGLRPDVSFMHKREFTFADAVRIYAKFALGNQDEPLHKFLALIKSRTFRVGAQAQQFRASQFMWNSGVLGLHRQVAGLLPEIIALNDALYRGSGWITSEQIAFSLALPVETRLLPSTQYVMHYWGQPQKLLMDGMLSALNSAHFRALGLAERLAETRALTGRWRREVRLHLARQCALYSLANGDVKAGVKYAALVLLAAPFDTAFARNIFVALRQGITYSERPT